MPLDTKLRLRQTQKLVMTQSLRQAIKLLPLARLELVQRIRQELAENPFLEEQPDEGLGDELEDELAQSEPTNSEGVDLPTDEEGQNEATLVEADWELFAQAYFDDGFPEGEFEEKPAIESTLSKEVSLHEHLLWQLSISARDEREKALGSFIIGNIDGNGYLSSEIEEIAGLVGVASEEVERVLRLIQTFEPTGVASRSLQECLLLQLQSNAGAGELAKAIITWHLDDLAEGKLDRIGRHLRISSEELSEALQMLRNLNPFPGRLYSSFHPEYITPDITVIKVDGEYQVILNEEDIPRLRLNPYYLSVLRRQRDGSDSARKYLEEKFHSALWLIRGIEQRRRTLYKVASSIVRFQRDFLDYGLAHLRPLVLRQVAEDIEMHESTVSRVTTSKYMETPQGIFELKYFFHSRLNTPMGEGMSSVRVKDLIRQRVAKEPKSSPYTDQDLVEYLGQHSISIARRTVAKYRKELRISSSSRRRKLYSLG